AFCVTVTRPSHYHYICILIPRVLKNADPRMCNTDERCRVVGPQCAFRSPHSGYPARPWQDSSGLHRSERCESKWSASWFPLLLLQPERINPQQELLFCPYG